MSIANGLWTDGPGAGPAPLGPPPIASASAVGLCWGKSTAAAANDTDCIGIAGTGVFTISGVCGEAASEHGVIGAAPE